MDHSYFTYILANKTGGTLYIGVTNDLVQRIWQHKNKLVKGFTSKYGVDRLIYYEHYSYIDQAIRREKQLKKWKRQWKIRLLEERNPDWLDLYPVIVGPYVSFDC